MSSPHPPLLRSPPFPWVDAPTAAVSQAAAEPGDGRADLEAIIAMIRQARVGGAFWLPPLQPVRRPVLIVRAAAQADLAPLLASARTARRAGEELLCILPPTPWGETAARDLRAADLRVQTGDFDPWSALGPGTRLVAPPQDEWHAIAQIAGATSVGERAADIANAILAGTSYRDPFTGEPADVAQAIAILADWRRQLDANRRITVAMGMAWWKREAIDHFLWADRGGRGLFFADRADQALAAANGGAIAAWPSRIPEGLAAEAAARGVPLVMVEDGFIRSVGLGADLHPPYSIAVDLQGIHYDPAGPSDLETILATADFSPALATRAEALIDFIVAHGISKYGRAAFAPARNAGAGRTVLVAGQVEDDLSVKRGGGEVAGNLDLLARARALEPDATILFKPHPDVDAGHRQGRVPDAALLAHADLIVRDEAMPSLLARVDAVHVLTSLTGFEALLRGREVVTHGRPFYAGWGLTRDLAGPLPRRGRALTLAELVAGVLILYPRYLDPATALPCPPEVLLDRFSRGQLPRPGWIVRARKWQGRLAKLLGTATS